MYFSKSTGGFYVAEIHGDGIPADAVEITRDYHTQLLRDISNDQIIAADENDYPIATAPPRQVVSKDSLLTDLADHRWQIETGGIVVAGTPIKTDRESQAQLSSAYTSLKGALISDTPWKTADGTFVRVTLAQIEPIAKAVAAHVRACFAAEEVHCQAIAALQTQAELDAYDIAIGWPTGQ